MNPLLLIDSYAWIYRSFYAVRALTNSKGVPTNAVFAMLRFLLGLEDTHPDCDGCFVYDCGRPVRRTSIAPDYKANRPPMPEELKLQIPVIRRLVSAFGWPSTEHENYEADDLIACFAVHFPDRTIAIASGDKDLSQLVNDKVYLLAPSKDGKSLEKRGPAEVHAKFGVPPSAILDYLSLTGDSADNIPGVPGVGPKTAAQLLTEFGSADAVFAHPERIERASLRAKIESSAERFRMNRELIRLADDLPGDMNLTGDFFHRKKPDYETILSIADEMEIRSMKKELEKRCAVRHETEAEKNEGPVQMELF